MCVFCLGFGLRLVLGLGASDFGLGSVVVFVLLVFLLWVFAFGCLDLL